MITQIKDPVNGRKDGADCGFELSFDHACEQQV